MTASLKRLHWIQNCLRGWQQASFFGEKRQIAPHVFECWHLLKPPPKASSVLNMTPLMDRLSLSRLINPCSMACSSLVTITPCACCHLAVLCLQSYSVHLSDTIYGKQFVVYHGSCSFLRTFFSLCLCFLHICYSCWISSQVWNLRISRFHDVVQIRWSIASSLFRVL